MQDGKGRIPKPMVMLGKRPLIWHVMKYYAHYGHTDFILCLGYGSESIKDYFLDYSELLSNDFKISGEDGEVTLLSHDLKTWNITFVHTGMKSVVGQRLKLVEPYLEGEEVFLANYSDGLTNVPLDEMIDEHEQAGVVASLLCVRPSYSFHTLVIDDKDRVQRVEEAHESDLWMNGGYFVLRREIFDYIGPGEDLVNEPFARLIEKGDLLARRHEGFYYPVDTLKDRQVLEDMLEAGNAPWSVWDRTQDA